MSEQQLRRKYYFICFFDSDSKEIRKVVNVEWSKRIGSLHAQYTLVTQKVASHTGNNIANITTYLGGIDLEPYYINDEMCQMIANCPSPFNSTRIILAL